MCVKKVKVDNVEGTLKAKELETKSTENVDDILGNSLDDISVQSGTETPEHEKVEKFLKQSSRGLRV